MGINLDEYDLVPVEKVSCVTSPKEEVLYDITLQDNHTFFIKIPNTDDFILAHNCDGSHITSMLIGWFKRFAPSLFTSGRICKLVTPLIIIKNSSGKITNYFFTVDEFRKWEKTSKGKNNILYLKGLGSWEREDLQYLIDAHGIDAFIKRIELDDTSDVVVDEWLGTDSEPRKKYLRNCIFDINNV